MTRPVCEVVVKMIPSIRATVAAELIENYNMSQAEVASVLGVSQPAISQYLRSIRGKQPKAMRNKLVENEIKKLCQKMADRKGGFEVCGICKTMRDNKMICQMCRPDASNEQRAGCSECF